jgi:hypothetical protein
VGFEEGTLPSPKQNVVVFADAIVTAAVSVDAVVAVVGFLLLCQVDCLRVGVDAITELLVGLIYVGRSMYYSALCQELSLAQSAPYTLCKYRLVQSKYCVKRILSRFLSL